jgi:hypothetical protein
MKDFLLASVAAIPLSFAGVAVITWGIMKLCPNGPLDKSRRTRHATNKYQLDRDLVAHVQNAPTPTTAHSENSPYASAA